MASNYDLTRDRMEKAFLSYDQEKMIRKFHLDASPEHLFITFVGQNYRIGRATGMVERICGSGPVHAGFNESMTIFDVLCCAKDGCRLSGEFVPINEVDGIKSAAAKPSPGLFSNHAEYFAHRPGALRDACVKLGGTPEKIGDVSYRIPLFDFLPVVLQFWDADDEFGAVLKIMWDRRVIDFMHYETTFYATGHLMEQLKNLTAPPRP